MPNDHYSHLLRFDQPAADIKVFEATLAQQPAELTYERTTIQGVPVYSADELRRHSNWTAVTNEWASVLKKGAGVFVVEQAFTDHAVLDQATEAFEQIIQTEREQNLGADHFAAAGTNDRIWNALEKLGLVKPEVFSRYYSNDIIALASEAWLGPNYQMTSQVNVVRPGGAAQRSHRDYHLGFQPADEVARYPPHVHELSKVLTLQGGIAHCDVPVESGPTRLLPFSQQFEYGYLTYRLDSYERVFDEHHVALPLAKGDAVFFNPGLHHAAGENQTLDCNRLVNLLQVSSAFGRPMEYVNRVRLCEAVYPTLLELSASQQLSKSDIARTVFCTADSYPFPTNLDTDPPTNGLAPATQAQLVLDALDRRLEPREFRILLIDQHRRRT